MEEKGRSDGNRNPFRSKKFRNMKAAMVRGSRGASGNCVTMADLKNKISIFRDLLDLPPYVGSVSVDEWLIPQLLIVTLKDIRRMYPNLKLGSPMLEGKDASMRKSLKLFCDTLKSLGDMWTSEKGMSKCKYDPSKKLGHRKLERTALKLLDEMIKLARERLFEETDEEEEMRCHNHPARSFGQGESRSYSDGTKSPNPGSPVTPTSVLPGPRKSRGKCHSPPLSKSQSVQSIRKLSSMDLKRISLYMLPDAITVAQENKHSVKLNKMDWELQNKKAAEVEQDYANKVSEDDGMVDYMEMSNEVKVEAEGKSDALKIGRNDLVGKVSEDEAIMVSEDDGMVDYMEMSIEVNAEAEVKSDALKIGRSDLVGKVSDHDVNKVSNDDVMVDYMEISRSDSVGNFVHEGRNCINSPYVEPVTAPVAIPKQEEPVPVSLPSLPELPSNVAEQTASEPVSEVLVPPLMTPQPPAAVLTPDLTEQDQPMQLLLCTSPPPPSPLPPPMVPVNMAGPHPPPPPHLETSGKAVCAPPPPPLSPPTPERASVQLPGTSGNAVCAPPPPPPMAVKGPAPPLPPPLSPINGSAPPPPPPIGGSNGAVPPPPMPNGSAPPPPPPMGGSNGPVPPPPMPNGSAPPPLPMSGSNGSVPPPPMPNGSAPPLPPPMGGSKGLIPPPTMPNGGGGPPPPPGGGGASLRLKKAATKLKRSSQMGTLYRRLKGKVEGTSSEGKTSGGRKAKAGSAPAGGKQGMADALAEMTKKSAYFIQIEEDVKNYLGVVKELKKEISAFQTSDMSELVKFHRHVESHLEKLTDESQVLARCEDFPCKKLEALRMSASLYTKLDTMVTTLRDWTVGGLSLAQQLDKADSYLNKIKVELDALERTKDEELKRFQAQKINFDFGILIKIKELMVDVSSNCMELALKEKKEAESKENGQPNEGLRKLMWKAFQFAFRVYTFAGGQDERADRLTKELAEAIESGY